MHKSSSHPPLISVIVPSYNYGHLIAETLSCLQSQSYENWECLIVDDGSTDNTAAVVNSFIAEDARFQYFSQTNQRQAAARNLGLKESKGSYVQFLDSDDLIEQRKLELHVNYLEQHPEVDIVYSGVRYFSSENPDERLISRRYSMWDDGEAWMPELSGAGQTLLPALLQNNIMVVNSPLVRRRLIDSIGSFDVTLTPVEDWQYWIRCAAAGATFYYDDTPESRALVRHHSLSASVDGRRMLQANKSMRKTLATLPMNDAMKDLNRLMLAEAEGLLGVEETVNGNLWTGISGMCKAALIDRRPRAKAKWLFCAASAPFVSTKRLHEMVTAPVADSVLGKLKPKTR
jgi:glycosyltransferase involved in cell wall biosynthesis